MKRSYSPWIEIAIFICTVILVFLLGYPQYQEKAEISKRYQVIVSTYSLQAAVENYAAYNEGRFPQNAGEIEEFYTPSKNPYSNQPISIQDIQIFAYDLRSETNDSKGDSRNASLKGKAGGLAYGYFVAPADSIASSYGIIGFDKSGKPLAEKLPSGDLKVFVLSSEE